MLSRKMSLSMAESKRSSPRLCKWCLLPWGLSCWMCMLVANKACVEANKAQGAPIFKIGPEQELHDLMQQGYELQFISVHFRPQTFGWLAVQNLCFDARQQPSKTDCQIFTVHFYEGEPAGDLSQVRGAGFRFIVRWVGRTFATIHSESLIRC